MAINLGMLGAMMGGGGGGIAFPCAPCVVELATLREWEQTSGPAHADAARAALLARSEPDMTTTVVLGTPVCDLHALALLELIGQAPSPGGRSRALPRLELVRDDARHRAAAERDGGH